MKSKNKKIAVLYHKNCSDGFGAAFAAWKKFGASADYIGVEHQTALPDDLVGKEVYLVDFSYSEKDTKKLLEICKSLTIIDHHISAESIIKLAHNYSYDLSHSGAVLSWKYFHPKKQVLKLLRHIEDIDLWKFKLSGTREFMAAIGLYNFDFAAWNKIAKDFENPAKRKKYFEAGKIINKYRDKIIERAISQSDKVKFQNEEALVVNSQILQSEIGNALVKKGASIGIIWSQRNGKRYFSLRANGKVDVAKLAHEFGGGGHRSAAGFTLASDQTFPWKNL